MLGLTIGVGAWRRTAELAADAARRHTGLEVHVLGDEVWHGLAGTYSYPGFLKLHVFDLCDAEDALIFDADAIHINTWRPQDYAGQSAVVGVPDAHIGSLAGEASVSAAEYINAGVMILNRRHHESLLRLARELHAQGERPVHREQALINKARAMLGIPLLSLDKRFNHLLFFDDPTFDPKQTVIAHWTCQEKDLSAVEAFCRVPEIVCQKNAADAAGRFMETIPPYPSGFKGRGIVTCAGGMRYNTCAWVLIRRLRDLGCELPIQVWYLGDGERDEEWMDLVGPFGVSFVDGTQVQRRHPHPRLGGWEAKPYAMLHCPFKEVLYLALQRTLPEYRFTL